VEKRPFGRTGLQVSAIGFGCWEIGGGYGQIEETEFSRAVGRALDLGINCFDTAEGYGLGASERALGKALGSRRRDAIIVTKFGIGYRDKPNLRDASRARCMASIEKSLENLGTDCVDVYLIHWPDHVTPFEETMRALEDVVRQGKARFVGVSNFKRDEIEACMQVRRVDVGQYGWNLFDRRMQRDVLRTAGRTASASWRTGRSPTVCSRARSRRTRTSAPTTGARERTRWARSSSSTRSSGPSSSRGTSAWWRT
jgi:aryl-alcohol dehydrogenase-like predicted oxidoreductase